MAASHHPCCTTASVAPEPIGGPGATFRASPPPHPLGISLAGMDALIAGAPPLAGRTTEWLKKHVVLPATAASGASYASQLQAAASPAVRAATVFISHTYSELFLNVRDAIAAWEARDASRAGSFYYFDLLCVNQHKKCSAGAHVCSQAQAVELIDFAELQREFGGSVRAIGRTLLVLRYENPVPLTRAWCVLEMATTLAVKATLEVIMPPDDAAAFTRSLLTDFDSIVHRTCRVDVRGATAHVKSDQDNIHRLIRETLGGPLATSQRVIGALQQWMAEVGRAALGALPPSERATSSLIVNLAALLKDHGKGAEAEALYRQAIAGHPRAPPGARESAALLLCKSNLANLLSEMGGLREAEAEALCREAMTGRTATLGGEHPDTLKSVSNLAIIKKKRDLPQAEKMFRAVLAAQRRNAQLGKEHPDTLATMNNLANALADPRLLNTKRLSEAESLYRGVLEVRTRTLPQGHPSTLKSRFNLAQLLRAQNKLGEAERMLTQQLEDSRRVLGEDHHRTLESQRALAEVQALARSPGRRGSSSQGVEAPCCGRQCCQQ